jgi:hypothetical protein
MSRVPIPGFELSSGTSTWGGPVDAKVMCEVCGITYYSVHETLLLDAWILNALPLPALIAGC